MERLVVQVLPVPPAFLVRQVFLEIRVPRDLLQMSPATGTSSMNRWLALRRDPPTCQSSSSTCRLLLDLRAQGDSRDHREPLDPKVFKAYVESLENQVHQGQWVPLVPVDYLAFREKMDHRERTENRDLRVLSDQWARGDCPECLACRE